MSRPVWFEVPWQEILDILLHMPIQYLVQYMFEIGLRVDAVQFAGADQRCHAGPCDRAIVIACEERIFPRERNRSDRILDSVRIHFEASIVQEPGQPVPSFEAVSDV